MVQRSIHHLCMLTLLATCVLGNEDIYPSYLDYRMRGSKKEAFLQTYPHYKQRHIEEIQDADGHIPTEILAYKQLPDRLSPRELQHFLIKRWHSKSIYAAYIHFTDAKGLAFFPDIKTFADQPPTYVYFTVNMYRVSVRPYSGYAYDSYRMPFFHFYDNIIYHYDNESQTYRRTLDIEQEGQASRQASNMGLPQLSTNQWNTVTPSAIVEISPADLNDFLSSQQLSYVIRYFDHESRCRIKKPFLESLPHYVLLYSQAFGDEDIYKFSGNQCDLDNPYPILYKWNENINRYQLVRKLRAYPTHVLYYVILVYGAHIRYQNTIIDYLKNDE